MKVYINDNLLYNNIIKADSFLLRLVGLLGKKCLNSSEGLLLQGCSSIHCFFMKFTIDVIYISKDMTVLYKETVQPNKIGKIVKNTKHVLELAEGAAKGVKIGDVLQFKD
jgi:uncharacterized membrane protein (UPF0127 family)